MPVGRGGLCRCGRINPAQGESKGAATTGRYVSVWAVLAAAGRGERLGSDRPKAFAKLRERPLLGESVERREGSHWIAAMGTVPPPGWAGRSTRVAEELACTTVVACASGGE